MRMLALSMIMALTLWPLSGSASGSTLECRVKVAFLGLHFNDMSTEGAYNGIRADEVARIKLSEEYIVQRLQEYGFDVVSNVPIADALAKIFNPAQCNGCDLKFGRELGVKYVVVSELTKVSNLIQAVNIQVRDVETGRQPKGRSVDIRGNTDIAWERGLRYIFDHHIFDDCELS